MVTIIERTGTSHIYIVCIFLFAFCNVSYVFIVRENENTNTMDQFQIAKIIVVFSMGLALLIVGIASFDYGEILIFDDHIALKERKDSNEKFIFSVEDGPWEIKTVRCGKSWIGNVKYGKLLIRRKGEEDGSKYQCIGTYKNPSEIETLLDASINRIK